MAFFEPLASWLVSLLAIVYNVIDEKNKSSNAYVPDVDKLSYSEPHRDPKTEKIIIENSVLYENDCKKYGVSQTMQWVREGKYNLTPDALKLEELRLEKNRIKLYTVGRIMTEEEKKRLAEINQILGEDEPIVDVKFR